MASARAPHSNPLPTVLVVEDEPGLRFIVGEMLETDGRFNVLIARSGDEAIEILAQQPQIDCVFTDVRMPGRHDGLDLADHIRRQYPGIKVMLTSGHILARQTVGNLPFLPKPYELASLSHTLEALIQS